MGADGKGFHPKSRSMIHDNHYGFRPPIPQKAKILGQKKTAVPNKTIPNGFKVKENASLVTDNNFSFSARNTSV